MVVAAFWWQSADASDLLRLSLPLLCDVGQNCVVQNYVDHDPSSSTRDYACGMMTYDGHKGTDFRLRTVAAMQKGIVVVAAANGRIARTRDGMPDKLYQSADPAVQGRECGNGIIVQHRDGWETQYCHIAQGSIQVNPGDKVKVGQPIGRVGLSGKTEFPHLHFAVRHKGEVVDPFAYEPTGGACSSGVALWDSRLRPLLAYRPGFVLNTGFAAGPVTMKSIESGEVLRSMPGPRAPALVAFARAIGLRAGDIQRITIRRPDGRILVKRSAKPLAKPKAQYMMFVGKKRRAAEWPSGTYRATYSIHRAGVVAIEKNFDLRF